MNSWLLIFALGFTSAEEEVKINKKNADFVHVWISENQGLASDQISLENHGLTWKLDRPFEFRYSSEDFEPHTDFDYCRSESNSTATKSRVLEGCLAHSEFNNASVLFLDRRGLHLLWSYANDQLQLLIAVENCGLWSDCSPALNYGSLGAKFPHPRGIQQWFESNLSIIGVKKRERESALIEVTPRIDSQGNIVAPRNTIEAVSELRRMLPSAYLKRLSWRTSRFAPFQRCVTDDLERDALIKTFMVFEWGLFSNKELAKFYQKFMGERKGPTWSWAVNDIVNRLCTELSLEREGSDLD